MEKDPHLSLYRGSRYPRRKEVSRTKNIGFGEINLSLKGSNLSLFIGK